MNEPQTTPKNDISMIVLFFVFFAGFGSIFIYRYVSKPKPIISLPPASVDSPPIPEPSLALKPPAQALSGTLTVLSGKADMFTRTGDAFTEASTGAQILLGESVATKGNSTAKIEIPDIVTVTMKDNSEIVFANLFPTNMVLQQKAGTVDYVLAEGVSPVAIRAFHSLVSIRSGEANIRIIDTDVFVTVQKGSVKLALVDTDNDTHVYDIQAGKRAIIDDTNRTVRIR